MKSASGSGRFRAALAAVLVGLLLPVSSIASAEVPAEVDPCEEFRQADAGMNAVYRQVLARRSADKVFVAAFRKSQRTWLAYRNAHLEALYPGPPGLYGSILPTCRCLALADLTRGRTETLKRWTEEAQEGDVCAGSTTAP